MKDKICIVCKNISPYRLTRSGVEYNQCSVCGTLFCAELDNSNMVGGANEVPRNNEQNTDRINRFKWLVGMGAKILDYGCGHGMLTLDCDEAGMYCDGYDKYNPRFDKFKEGVKYNLISMVEVIEHLTHPFIDLSTIYDKLVDNGIVYIETSFVDVAKEENISLEDFFYIEPKVGHCTLFSHYGLDLLMKSKGFTPLNHINRNVRIYQKAKRMMTLITPTQGNPVALKRTIDSLSGIISEVIVGDVCIFEKDEKTIQSYGNEVNLKLIQLPFNYIFCNGFSATLNTLAQYATNDWVVYLNVGEILTSDKGRILEKLTDEYNSFYIDHATEKHHWYRVYNKNYVQWGGLIHEEITGICKPCDNYPLFRFADTDKDTEDEFYSAVMNAVKELVYFNLYLKLADQPHLIDNTNIGWVQFAKDGFHSFIERLHQKEDMYEAFLIGDKKMFMDYIFNNETFKKLRFESSLTIEYQGDKKYLL